MNFAPLLTTLFSKKFLVSEKLCFFVKSKKVNDKTIFGKTTHSIFDLTKKDGIL